MRIGKQVAIIVRTAINIENQCFTKQTPDFTPKNIKSGVSCFSIGVQWLDSQNHCAV